MKSISVSIITYSDLDKEIKECLPHVYVNDVRLLLLAYAIDNEKEVHIVDISRRERIPQDVFIGLKNPKIIKYTFGDGLESRCIEHALKTRVVSENWMNLATITAKLGLPDSLEEISCLFSMNLPEVAYVNRCISLFCEPQYAGKLKFRVYQEEYPFLWKKLKEYCMWRVKVEQELKSIIQGYTKSDLWIIREKLNKEIRDKGVYINEHALRKEIELYDKKLNILCEKYENWAKAVSEKRDERSYSKLQEITKEVELLIQEEYRKLKKNIDKEGIYHQPVDWMNYLDYPSMLFKIAGIKEKHKLILIDYSQIDSLITRYLAGETMEDGTTEQEINVPWGDEKSQWNYEHSRVVEFYEKLERGIKYVLYTNQPYEAGLVRIFAESACLCIQLPFGNKLTYINPQINMLNKLDLFYFDGYDEEKRWVKKKCTLQSLVQDIIKAAESDIVTMLALKCDEKGIDIISLSDEKILLNVSEHMVETVKSMVKYIPLWMQNYKIKILIKDSQGEESEGVI